MEEMDRSLAYLMRRIVLSIESAVNKHARLYGLRIEEIWVLFRVLAKDNPTVGELAADTGIERSTLSRVLTRMQANRLVTRQRLSKDQRTVRIRLTEKGRMLAHSRHPTFRDYEAFITRGLSADDIRKLKATLSHMTENAAAIGSEGENVTKRPSARKSAPAKTRATRAAVTS